MGQATTEQEHRLAELSKHAEPNDRTSTETDHRYNIVKQNKTRLKTLSPSLAEHCHLRIGFTQVPPRGGGLTVHAQK